MLKDVEETDLFLFRREEDMSLLIKQFCFIILHYLLNTYWPHISHSVRLRRVKPFCSLVKVLTKNNVMFKLGQTVDSSKPQNLLIVSVGIRLG